MKIEWQLTGVFKRIQENPEQPLELSQLVDKIQAIAHQQHYHSLPYIQSNFGLDVLSESTLLNFLPSSPYLIPTLKLLHPSSKPKVDLPIKRFEYSFSSNKINFPLNPDDPQLPIWINSEIQGKYTLSITSSSDPQTQAKWEEVQQLVKKLLPVDIINQALKSSDHLSLQWQFSSNLVAILRISELPVHFREVIAALRLKKDATQLSPDAQSLITTYHRKFSRNIQIEPPLNSISEVDPRKSLLMGKNNNRKGLEMIINEAQEFLLISSYRIEDQSITNLIAQKAASLKQGVWILSDYGNQVLNRIDPRVDSSDEYEKSDLKKKECLRILARSGAYIRSGNFHLKTYISENHAYLGSCNLTGGSLDFNPEAGMVWTNDPQHQQLIQIFSHHWRSLATDMITPSLNGITRTSIDNIAKTDQNQPNFLNARAYERDIKQELLKLPKQSQIKIYTRNFEPSPTIQELLKHKNYKIYYGSFQNSQLTTHLIPNLHAKITILGKQCAYIGGINFAFTHQSHPLHDLMYKTTDSAVIEQIESNLYKILS